MPKYVNALQSLNTLSTSQACQVANTNIVDDFYEGDVRHSNTHFASGLSQGLFFEEI